MPRKKMNKLYHALLIIALLSCSQAKNETKDEVLIEQELTKEIAVQENQSHEKNELKQDWLHYPYKDSIQSDCVGEPIQKDDWENQHFNKIEQFNADFNYKIIGAFQVKENQLLLISRCYPEENIHWLVILEKGKFKDKLMTAYDNAEGFSSIKSKIEEDNILVKEWNDFSDENYTEKKYSIIKARFVLQTDN